MSSALEHARKVWAGKQFAEAEAAYAACAEAGAGDLPALADLGWRALRGGRPAAAQGLAALAEPLSPEDPALGELIGVCHLDAGRFEKAVEVLSGLLRRTPQRPIARLHLGAALEALGQEADAVREYVGAVEQAHKSGRWLSRETTAPWLLGKVRHGIDYTRNVRRARVEPVLRPLRARDPAGLARLEAVLPVWLGELPHTPPDSRQRPKGPCFPGLPATPYLDPALFPWLGRLESAYDAIRAEAAATLADGLGYKPFLDFTSSEQAGQYLGGKGEQRWDAFFFYRHGARYDANCARCPATAAVLDSLPLVRIRGHAPEICFSLLAPGTHILPHHGVTNTRAVVHLPLIVPDDCALSVGGEEHAWREGRCVVFDDTFQHEAWNRSAQPRVVLILDCWNPHLSPLEQDAVAAMTERLGELAGGR